MTIDVNSSQVVYTITSGASGTFYVYSTDLITTNVYSTSGLNSSTAQINVYVNGNPYDNQYNCSPYGDAQATSNVYLGSGTNQISGTADNSSPYCP